MLGLIFGLVTADFILFQLEIHLIVYFYICIPSYSL